MDKEYTYLGNFSAVEPVYSRLMCCHDCQVDWIGCYDNFMCPKCFQGDIPPNSEPKLDLLNELFK